jgi:hypothetical protein
MLTLYAMTPYKPTAPRSNVTTLAIAERPAAEQRDAQRLNNDHPGRATARSVPYYQTEQVLDGPSHVGGRSSVNGEFLCIRSAPNVPRR